MPEFCGGEDYPWLCKECRATIESIAILYREGVMEDTDNEEAPCDKAYDEGLFCGGHECAKKENA